MRTLRKANNTKYKGSLLLELLIVIAILAIILLIGSQAVYVSLRSSKTSGERDIASNLASEGLEAVRAATEEDWENIYSLTKTSQNYYPSSTSSNWVLATGTEVIALNNTTYTRTITISNVSRDQTPGSRLIETTYSAVHDDPSTQQVTVTVSYAGAPAYSTSEYFFRWKNKICQQTAWSSSGSSGVKICPDTTYSSSTNLGIPGTSLQVQ